MVREVGEGVGDHLVPGLLHHHATAHQQLPGCREMLVGGLAQGVEPLGDRLVVDGQQSGLRVRRGRPVARPAGRVQVELVLEHGHRDPGRHRGDEL
jgi:hypothetical protein